jgi:hypothetical protein
MIFYEQLTNLTWLKCGECHSRNRQGTLCWLPKISTKNKNNKKNNQADGIFKCIGGLSELFLTEIYFSGIFKLMGY